MSLERYRQALAVMNLRPNEIQWFTQWVSAYATSPQVQPKVANNGGIPVDRDLVIGFRKSLRDKRVEAWRRLQAARAIEIYQATVLQNSVVNFRPIRDKLTEIAGRQCVRPGASRRRCPIAADAARAGSRGRQPMDCEASIRDSRVAATARSTIMLGLEWIFAVEFDFDQASVQDANGDANVPVDSPPDFVCY